MKFHATISGDTALELPLAYAHFLPWFTLRAEDFPLRPDDAALLDFRPRIEAMRHWNDVRSGYRRAHLHMPSIGQYDSRDPRVIEWQIHTALTHDITGFLINWYGTHSVENVITLHWLRGLQRWNATHPDRPFYYFLSLDSQAQWPTEGKMVCSMVEDFTFIKNHLITDAYLHRDGRPVFAVFPYENNCQQWRESLDVVWGADGADLIWNGVAGLGENGCYPWVRPDQTVMRLESPYVWPNPDDAGDRWLASFYRDANRSEHGIEYIMGGVWPGFDDQLVSWAWNAKADSANIRPRVMCRETTRGNTLDLTWQAYLDYLTKWAAGKKSATAPAPLMQIITWNDYNEATTIEPTHGYGYAPLELCKKKIGEARKIWRSAKAKLEKPILTRQPASETLAEPC